MENGHEGERKSMSGSSEQRPAQNAQQSAQQSASQNAPQKPSIEFTRCALNAMKTLDVALAYHFDWLKTLHRTLVCAGPSNPDDQARDAHCRCRFGQWYYGQGMADLGAEPGFQALDAVHRDMHVAAAALLSRHDAGQPVNGADYDRFMELAIGFKQGVRLFQYEIMNRVCVVDQLTGVWNRHAMYLRLAEEMERIQRGGRGGVLCMMDIDHFKAVNDSYGHPAGDKVLQEVAALLTRGLRRYDAVFRFGGEEFLVCLPDTTLSDARVLMERMRQELSELDISVGTHRLKVTASLGLAELGGLLALDETIEWADHALLMAKASGRNQVCVWDDAQQGQHPLK